MTNKIRILAACFQAAQDITEDQASEIAEKLLDKPDEFAAAALEWRRSGVMPDQPVVQGHWPSELDRDYFPT